LQGLLLGDQPDVVVPATLRPARPPLNSTQLPSISQSQKGKKNYAKHRSKVVYRLGDHRHRGVCG